MILSKILLLAFSCFVCIHEAVVLVKWKYMSEDDRHVEQVFAATYSIIIILWMAAWHLIEYV